METVREPLLVFMLMFPSSDSSAAPFAAPLSMVLEKPAHDGRGDLAIAGNLRPYRREDRVSNLWWSPEHLTKGARMPSGVLCDASQWF